jgi:hypothetical protein
MASAVRPGKATMIGAELPWAELPRGISALLEDSLPQLVEEIVSRIPQEIPEYSAPWKVSSGRQFAVVWRSRSAGCSSTCPAATSLP